jgi:hypothetical protein
VTTDTRALTVNGAPATRSTTRVANLRLLGGRITADAVKAVSTTARTRSGLRSTGAGSAFVNLRIDGRALSATPRPNQRVNLPGLGYVILNHRYVENRGARGRTQMLEAHLTDGTTVIVSHARSELRPVGGILGGVAFGSSALASSGRALAANGGPSARLFEPCGGTHGRTISNRIATLQVPNVVTLSNVVSTAKGTVSPSKASEQLTNHSEQASLLNGLVRARAVRAVANGAAVNGARAFNGRGSGFLDLSVQGHPGIGAHPAPNTRIRLAGLGMLWLHRVIRRPSSFEVRMVELDVTQRNNRGLPVGTVVKVGVAKASIK